MSPEDQKNTVPSRAEIESLFVNNADVDKIGAYIERVNPIKIIGVEKKERTHSNILSWLLNPQENHGLGDTFLKAFLSEALRDPRNTHRPSRPSAIEVSQADLKDAEIKREWKRIDFFIRSPKNGWVFVIENKFGSCLVDWLRIGSKSLYAMKIVIQKVRICPSAKFGRSFAASPLI